MLGRLGFQLLGRLNVWHQRQVDVADVASAQVGSKLPHRFEEREALDVADGAPDLADHHIGVVLQRKEVAFDLVGDVGDDLYGSPEKISPALLADYAVVDAARSHVVDLPHLGGGEPLVVAEV